MRTKTPSLAFGEPLTAINITPLIDVMLVLLIMMIMTLPPPTHKVGVDLPGRSSNGALPPAHRLSIMKNGAYLWDGAPLADGALSRNLTALKNDPAGPVLHMETHPAASYDRFDHTIAAVKNAGIDRVGFIDNPPGF